MSLIVINIPDEVMDVIDMFANDRIIPKYENRSDVVYDALRVFLMDIQDNPFDSPVYKEHIGDFQIDVALNALERQIRERRERRERRCKK